MEEEEETKITEKYRPTSLGGVRGNEEILICLRKFNLVDLPNMLFYGPSGTGKTTSIRALLNNKMSPINVLELNASDERGIDTVRNRIKQFAETSVEHRLVILDEADSMSKDAQGALRRIMEDYPNCRFCLICNYARKVIEPIQSRCAKFRFTPISPSQTRMCVVDILRKENVEVRDEEGLELLVESSDGDLRRLVNDIQGIKRAYGSISRENMEEFLGTVPRERIEAIYSILKDGEIGFKEAFDRIRKMEVETMAIVDEVFKRVLKSDREDRFRIIRGLGDIEVGKAIECSDHVQLAVLVGLFK
ncbi:RFC3 [Enterospora canceri]|uniref:RFC3 n=1 Tax=Enterospora canceri TaxID=1081671 RepID=A0A1Y1S8P3_9MICR|nr:RFC3 [Enterospora canceri]